MDKFEKYQEMLVETNKKFNLTSIEDPEEIRWVFKKMREIYDKIKNTEYKNIEMKYLSMGMSHDYKVALEEGSNMVRVGSFIFGKRNYN